ncbi:MAG: DUF6636 domain-containing protein [Thermoleophilia bacterium]
MNALRSANGPATPQRAPVLCVLLAASALFGLVSSASAASTTSFRSPSGNIHCFLTSDGAAQCWVVSAKCRGYEGATYAYSWAMDATRRPSRFCPGDFVRGRRVLAYGQQIIKGGNRCVSRQAGVTCTRQATGHGFFLSRERQRIF